MKYIIGNWKMNPETFNQARQIINEISDELKNLVLNNIKIILCPPIIWTYALKEMFSQIDFGAQDVFYENKGTFTGQISPAMLKDLNIQYALIGHSEKRSLLIENSQNINKKIKACLNIGITPIHIIGDLKATSIEDEDFDLITQILLEELAELKTDDIKKILFAYEPVFAISKGLGTGKAVPESHAVQAIKFIRHFIVKNFDLKEEDVKILYGGSSDSQNGPIFIKNKEIDGLLVGGASLVAKEFTSMIKYSL
jgi:triosephosphate isomerase